MVDSDPTQIKLADAKQRRSKWWLLYIFFIFSMEALGYSRLLTHPEAGVFELVSLAFSVGLYVGLFGFFLRKPILVPLFWHGFLGASIVFAHLYGYLSSVDLYQELPEEQKVIGFVVGATFYLPAAVALYLYGKKSDYSWRRAAEVRPESG